MNNQIDRLARGHQSEQDEHVLPQGARKQFVEPVMSSPVDVLEATTFFQGGTIGDNPPIEV